MDYQALLQGIFPAQGSYPPTSLMFPVLAGNISDVRRKSFSVLQNLLETKFYIKGAKVIPCFEMSKIVIFRDFLGCVLTTDQSIEDPKDLVKTNCQYYTF